MSRTTKALGIFAALVVVVTVVAVVVAGPTKHSHVTPTTKPVSVRTDTLSEQAVTSSLSVARAALFATTTPNTPVNPEAVIAAAAPSKGTLVILDNLGQIASDPHMIALAWYFGPKPNVACVLEPATRAGTPKSVTCPPSVLAQKVPKP